MRRWREEGRHCGDDDAGNTVDARPVDARVGDGGTTDTGGTAATVSATLNPTTVSPPEDIAVTITVTNFTLEAPSASNVTGHGHYHIYLDSETGSNYLAADSVSPVTVNIAGSVSAGSHSLRVALHNNDHSPVAPAVETVVPFTAN